MVTRAQIMKKVAKKLRIPKRVCNAVYESMVDEILRSLKNDEGVMLMNFLTLEIIEHPEHKGRNPATGVVEMFPPAKHIKCKLCKAMKETVKK